MVTIQDVAKAAGVSPMTVSNVINSRPHVRESTRDKVVKAMTDLDYRINVAARNLRAGRTATIGLAVPEVDRPYWGQLAARIIIAAEKHDLQVAIEQTGASRQNEIEALTMSRNRMYDGLILSTVGLGPGDLDKLRTDYPIVILGERIFEGPVDHVSMANVAGGREATRHLLEQGCRRIALFDRHIVDEIDVSSLRFDGYRQALDEAGIALDPDLSCFIEALTMAAGRTAVHELVDAEVTFDGIVCVTDTVGLGVLRGLADRGIRVPDEVKVIGFDNVLEGEFFSPSLSTIDPDQDAIAEKAVELLVNRIANGTSFPAVEFVSPHRVIARESTGG
ncbi:MAG: transcriptional regulator, LacI family protein [Frondihabitans sp.]|nr:transcriptional regulator, LacI family protein [Frondihabitans sp.]